MAIILDADVIIRGERGSFDLVNWLAKQVRDDIEIAAITIAELWHGVERATGVHRSVRETYLKAIIEPVRIIPYTEQTAYEQAKIWSHLVASGKMIGYYDLIVAAAAVENKSAIATFNRSHFELVPGLRIIEPK
jgi:predicted nucleic acid-binding protein